MVSRHWLLILALIFSYISLSAQKTKTVSAEYTYYAPETISIEEAKRTALDRAKIQAIADEFGTIVSQSTSTVISTKNGESDSQFFAFGGSDVKGEWIETLGEPQYDINFEDHLLVVTCRVIGNAREIQTSNIDIIAKPLRNGRELRNESYEFREGDDLYLYFKSPVDGFLTVFLVDEPSQTVYCALPYRNSDGNPQKIQADKEYILFSPKDAELSQRSYVDEYVMTANSEKEFNDFYILFSQEPFNKPALNAADDFTLPKTADWLSFQKWLSKIRSQNPNLSLSKILITISK